MPQRHGRQSDRDIVHVFERQGFDQRTGPFPAWVLSNPNHLRMCTFVHII